MRAVDSFEQALEVRDHPLRRHALPLAFAAPAPALLLEPWITTPDGNGIDNRASRWQSKPGRQRLGLPLWSTPRGPACRGRL